MIRRYLIEKDGERQNVMSLDGYEDWDIVSQLADMIPDPEAELVDGKWAIPLDILRARKWASLKAVRDELENGTAPTRYGDVQIDDRSKLKISGLALFGSEVEFTMADNSVVEVDPTLLWRDVIDYVSELHERARGARAALEAAGSAKKIEAVKL